MDVIKNLEAMLARGQESAPLRFGLGDAYLKHGHLQQAIEHLRQAVVLDTKYSAAWKLLGRALTEAGRPDEARQAYSQGIAVAQARGDVQAVKEMQVFLKRVERGATANSPKGGEPV